MGEKGRTEWAKRTSVGLLPVAKVFALYTYVLPTCKQECVLGEYEYRRAIYKQGWNGWKMFFRSTYIQTGSNDGY